MFFDFQDWKENLIIICVMGVAALIAYIYERRKGHRD